MPGPAPVPSKRYPAAVPRHQSRQPPRSSSRECCSASRHRNAGGIYLPVGTSHSDIAAEQLRSSGSRRPYPAPGRAGGTRGRTRMSRKGTSAPNIQSAQGDAGRNAYDASQRRMRRARVGIPRRRRDVPAGSYSVRACPACGLRIRDLIAAQLGFCDRCRDFTGMCGAGRRIICPDMMTRTTWHTPCTELGTVAWDITQVQSRSTIVLCRTHDTQVRFGGTPWILAAIALDPATSRLPQRPASGRVNTGRVLLTPRPTEGQPPAFA
jgi:hypothetical protein